MAQPPEQQPQAGLYGATAFVALGSNLSSPYGPPQSTVQRAITRLDSAVGPITGKSRLFRTPCFPNGSGPDYVNAAVMFETDLHPSEILSNLHQIEAEFRRERVERWGARTLDLDLLACGEAVLPDVSTQETWRHLPLEAQGQRAPEQLILPHPRLQDRGFVLVPLAEIAPDWRHPCIGKSVLQMLEALPEEQTQNITAIE